MQLIAHHHESFSGTRSNGYAFVGDVSGGMGLLTPEGPAVDAEEEAFIRAMKRKKKKKRKGLGM